MVERIQYDVFGRPDFQNPNGKSLDRDESIVDNPYLFQGRRWDGESKLFYYRNRYYDPGKGRFISRDPLGIWWDIVNYGNGYSSFGLNTHYKYDPHGLWTINEKCCNNIDEWIKANKEVMKKLHKLYQNATSASEIYNYISGNMAANAAGWRAKDFSNWPKCIQEAYNKIEENIGKTATAIAAHATGAFHSAVKTGGGEDFKLQHALYWIGIEKTRHSQLGKYLEEIKKRCIIRRCMPKESPFTRGNPEKNKSGNKEKKNKK